MDRTAGQTAGPQERDVARTWGQAVQRIKPLANPWHGPMEVVLVELTVDDETPPAVAAPPPAELASMVTEDLRSFAPDAFDPCPEIVETEVESTDEGLSITVTLRVDDEEIWATVIWDSDVLTANGSLAHDLRTALSDAIAAEIQP